MQKSKQQFLRTSFLILSFLILSSLSLKAQDTCTYMVWSDEFRYEGAPNPEKWGYDIGGNGWGNQELQYYTDSRKNSFVDNGVLTIKALKENGTWTSARLVTKGKGDWLRGRIEVKAKLPSGRGTWPAIWMLPTEWAYGGWPKSGEIDIMEHVGYDMGTIHGTIHTEAYNHSIGTQLGGTVEVENVVSEFHVYAIDWTEEEIIWYVDGEEYFRVENPHKTYKEWPFDKKFHLVLNIAIGGTWGGAEGVDPDLKEATMEIDYVRVYQEEIPGPTIESKKKTVEPGEELTFSTAEIEGVSYLWTFPDDVDVLSADTAAQITVQWGSQSGPVHLQVYSPCDTLFAGYSIDVVMTPAGDRFEIPLQDEQNNIVWQTAPGSSNQIDLSMNTGLLVDYQIEKTSENPYIFYEFNGFIDLTTYREMEISLKTPEPVPGSFRIDLVDENEKVNLDDLFKITSFDNDGSFHTYSYEFGQNPDGIHNLAAIDKIRIYINYGLFGKKGTGQLEIESIAFKSLETNASNLPMQYEIKIWPNPFRESFQIDSPHPLKSLEVYDLSGKLLQKRSSLNSSHSHLQLDAPSGVYLLRATTPEGAVRKVQIIKKDN